MLFIAISAEALAHNSYKPANPFPPPRKLHTSRMIASIHATPSRAIPVARSTRRLRVAHITTCTKMDKDAAARIQSAEARAHGGSVEKGSFASRAQSAAARNEAVDAEDAEEMAHMDSETAARIQSDEARHGGVQKGGHAAHAQAAAAHNEAAKHEDC